MQLYREPKLRFFGVRVHCIGIYKYHLCFGFSGIQNGLWEMLTIQKSSVCSNETNSKNNNENCSKSRVRTVPFRLLVFVCLLLLSSNFIWFARCFVCVCVFWFVAVRCSQWNQNRSQCIIEKRWNNIKWLERKTNNIQWHLALKKQKSWDITNTW